MPVKGQESAKRALEIAAAGGHNLLKQGPILPKTFRHFSERAFCGLPAQDHASEGSGTGYGENAIIDVLGPAIEKTRSPSGKNSAIRSLLARLAGRILIEGWVDEAFSRDDEPTPQMVPDNCRWEPA